MTTFFRRRIFWVSLFGLVSIALLIFFISYSLRDSLYVEDKVDGTICTMTILQDMPEITLCEDDEKFILLIATEDFSGHYYYSDIQQFVRNGQTRITKEKGSKIVTLKNLDGTELRIEFDIEIGGKLLAGRLVP